MRVVCVCGMGVGVGGCGVRVGMGLVVGVSGGGGSGVGVRVRMRVRVRVRGGPECGPGPGHWHGLWRKYGNLVWVSGREEKRAKKRGEGGGDARQHFRLGMDLRVHICFEAEDGGGRWGGGRAPAARGDDRTNSTGGGLHVGVDAPCVWRSHGVYE